MVAANLMKEKVLRKKVYFTFFILAFAFVLTRIPVAGIRNDYLAELFESTGVMSFMDSLSGGSFSHLSVAGFGITSYITATIITQLLSVVFPSIEQIRKDGERGRKRLEKIEFVLALLITFTSGLTLSMACGRNGLFVEYTPMYVVLAILSWIAGSFLVIFLAQKVEDHGIGNGVSMILAMNILARIPKNVIGFYNTKIVASDIQSKAIYICGLILVLYFFYVIAIYLQCGILNVPIKQIKKSASVMNSDGVIPINVNIANVLPVIYASTIMAIPSIIIAMTNANVGKNANKIIEIMNSSNWYRPTEWYQVIGLGVYILLIIAFGFFASSLTFSPDEIADSMRKNGDIIPGVLPGKDTVEFLKKRQKVLSFVNVLFLGVVVILPDFICAQLGITDFTFLGTSLVIIISALFDTSLRIRAASIHNDSRFALFHS